MDIKNIIYLTLREVRDQGWDLIDQFTNYDDFKVVDDVYRAIKDELY